MARKKNITGEFAYNKSVKTCLVRNEHLGGLTLGLINAKFVPLSVSCVEEDELYLLHRNLPSLPLYRMENQDLNEKVDLFAYSLNQQKWQLEVAILKDLLTNLNFPNFFIVTNGNTRNPKSPLDGVYKELGDILTQRQYYVDVSRRYYRSYGGSEYRINTFIMGTQHPAVQPKMKVRRDGLGSPATVDHLKALKVRNGYPEDWQLDVLNDKASFREQCKKMEKCVLPSLVKIMADTIIIVE